MIEHSIVIDHYAFVKDRNKTTSVGIVSNVLWIGAFCDSRLLYTVQSRDEFDERLMERINTTFTSEVDDSLVSQAQFYFDALWAGALGLNKTLGQSRNQLILLQ